MMGGGKHALQPRAIEQPMAPCTCTPVPGERVRIQQPLMLLPQVYARPYKTTQYHGGQDFPALDSQGARC